MSKIYYDQFDIEAEEIYHKDNDVYTYLLEDEALARLFDEILKLRRESYVVDHPLNVLFELKNGRELYNFLSKYDKVVDAARIVKKNHPHPFIGETPIFKLVCATLDFVDAVEYNKLS